MLKLVFFYLGLHLFTLDKSINYMGLSALAVLTRRLFTSTLVDGQWTLRGRSLLCLRHLDGACWGYERTRMLPVCGLLF